MTTFQVKYVLRLFLFGCFLWLPQAPLAAEDHFSVAPFDDPAALRGEPRELIYRIQTEQLPPGVILINTLEYDLLTEVSLTQLRNVITALDDYEQFGPRVAKSNGLPLSEAGVGERSWIHEVTLSFRILFFGEVYDYILRLDEVDLDIPGSYGVEWRLERSLDGKFADVWGGWFLREIVVDGTTQTYVRYWNRTDFADGSAGLETALKWFGPRDVRGNIMAFVEEARRREEE
jgi:hypothetical protein